MGDENLSENFKEILQESNLNEKAKEAIKIISKGGTPSGNQVARPELMNIIRFFMTKFECTKKEELSEENGSEEKPYICPKCDKKFSTTEDGCQHAAAIIDLDMEIFSSQASQEEDSQDLLNQEGGKECDSEKPFICSKCDKTFESEKEKKSHEKIHQKHCVHFRKNICKYGRSGKTSEGSCPFIHKPKCRAFMKDLKGECKHKDSCSFMHPVKCKTQKEKGKCTDKDCKLFHVKKNGKKSGHSPDPNATRDSNGNRKVKTPPKEPPQTPPEGGSEETDILKSLNSPVFLDKLVDQFFVRLDTRKKEQEMKGKIEAILSQLS